LEQPKKPGANRDIADLKARLGLLKGPAAGSAASGPAPGTAPAPFPGAAPPMAVPNIPGLGGGPPAPGRSSMPSMAAVSAPAAHDPYAAMKPPAGRTFDLRPVEDGIPVANVRSRGGKAILVILSLVLAAGVVVGYGFGNVAVGRRAYNATNAGARKIKGELEDMQKTVTQIGTAVALSQQRLAAEKRDALAYDGKLIADLDNVKLDPRPDTSRLFKVDYYRLEDLAVDRLMNYYYDTIALYNEVERHVKRSRADKKELEAVAARQAAKSGTYGVVFNSPGRVVVATMVEVGNPVCKGGGSDCPFDQVEGFQIRANTGAPWVNRKIAAKPAGDTVVPIDREHSPLFETLMSGSPDQVRMEQYKGRYQNIRLILARLTAEKKELFEAIDRAAARADLFAP
jgi:hypothetical protein